MRFHMFVSRLRLSALIALAAAILLLHSSAVAIVGSQLSQGAMEEASSSTLRLKSMLGNGAVDESAPYPLRLPKTESTRLRQLRPVSLILRLSNKSRKMAIFSRRTEIMSAKFAS